MKDTFNTDLRSGQKYENLVRSRLEAKGWRTHSAPPNCKEYDFILRKYDEELTTELRVEVKTDFKACETGNVCIEFCDRLGADSGVRSGCERDPILYILPDKDERHCQYFIIEKKKLLFIAANNYKFISQTGDKNGLCYIVPISAFGEYIKDISEPFN